MEPSKKRNIVAEFRQAADALLAQSRVVFEYSDGGARNYNDLLMKLNSLCGQISTNRYSMSEFRFLVSMAERLKVEGESLRKKDETAGEALLKEAASLKRDAAAIAEIFNEVDAERRRFQNLRDDFNKSREADTCSTCGHVHTEGESKNADVIRN